MLTRYRMTFYCTEAGRKSEGRGERGVHAKGKAREGKEFRQYDRRRGREV